MWKLREGLKIVLAADTLRRDPVFDVLHQMQSEREHLSLDRTYRSSVEIEMFKKYWQAQNPKFGV